MNDIEFNVESIQDFGAEVKAIRDGVEVLVQQITSAVTRVAQIWQDDSIVRVGDNMATINASILQACEQIEEIVERKIQNQIHWAEEYEQIGRR